MASTNELSDPRLVLFIIYGLFVVLLAVCSGSHLACVRRRFPFCWLRGRETAEEAQAESDGVIYELLPSARKKEIDQLRENIFVRMLGDFSLTLGKERMMQRRRSMAPSDADIGEGDRGPVDEADGDKNESEQTMQFTHILIPRPGLGMSDIRTGDSSDAQNDDKGTREVPIFCAVCLSEYELGDAVCWSSNAECTHVFHRQCVVQWLVALGKRESKMRRFPAAPSEKRLLHYRPECPCCRQAFVLVNCNKEDV